MTTDYVQTVEWSLWHFVAVLGGGVLASAVVGVAFVLIQGTDELSTTLILWSVVIQHLGSLTVLAYLSQTRGTGSFATDFGFALRLEHWWGLPAGAALQIGAAIVTAPLIRALFPEGPPQQSLVTVSEESSTLLEVVLLLFALVLLAPLMEELTFRGILLSRLLRSMAVWLAIGAQAATFALIHLADPEAIAALPGLFLIALVLGYAALKTGNLSLPLTLHAGVNLTAALLLLYGGRLLEWLDEMAGLEPAESVLRLLL